MKKSLLLLTSVSIAVLIAFILSRQKETSTEAVIVETDEVISETSPSLSVMENLNTDTATVGAETLDSESPEQPSMETSHNKASRDITPSVEDAMIKRELHRVEIAAKYSSSGDGTLTEADMRRYAEERYLKRRDLNGNGKLDGFELRAITQNQSSEGAPADLDSTFSRER